MTFYSSYYFSLKDQALYFMWLTTNCCNIFIHDMIEFCFIRLIYNNLISVAESECFWLRKGLHFVAEGIERVYFISMYSGELATIVRDMVWSIHCCRYLFKFNKLIPHNCSFNSLWHLLCDVIIFTSIVVGDMIWSIHGCIVCAMMENV